MTGHLLTMKKMVRARRDDRWLRSGIVSYLAKISSIDGESAPGGGPGAVSGSAMAGKQRRLALMGLGGMPTRSVLPSLSPLRKKMMERWARRRATRRGQGS